MDTNLSLRETEEKTKEHLLKTVDKKRKVLIKLTERLELLKMDLSKIEDEYQVRVGRLYIEDNLLDLQIIRFKKINELMDCGLTFEEAVLEIEENYISEKVQLEEENKRFEEYQERADEETSKDAILDVKKIWKKLVHKFHPDLITDLAEKKKREELMKIINKAYKDHDYKTLKNIEDKELIKKSADSDIESLTKLIIDMENAVYRLRDDLIDLRCSQWYVWYKKSEEGREKLLKDMEKKIILDIVKKQFILDNLQQRRQRGKGKREE